MIEWGAVNDGTAQAPPCEIRELYPAGRLFISHCALEPRGEFVLQPESVRDDLLFSDDKARRTSSKECSRWINAPGPNGTFQLHKCAGDSLGQTNGLPLGESSRSQANALGLETFPARKRESANGASGNADWSEC